jgi:hypothetical protein
MEMSLFERASRHGYKFESSIGNIGLDQLWGLPLTHATKVSLNDVARRAYSKLNDARDNVDFVGSSTQDPAVPALRDKLEIVKRVIEVKKGEQDTAEKAKVRADQKRRLTELLAEKEDEALKGKSADEIKALLAAL